MEHRQYNLRIQSVIRNQKVFLEKKEPKSISKELYVNLLFYIVEPNVKLI